MDKEPTYSKCGFYCNLCPAFKDNSQTEVDRQLGSKIWATYFGLHFKPDIIRCEGCQSDYPWKNGNMLPDRSCVIRACAVHNEAATCAHCSRFPCEEYSKRVPGAELREQRERSTNTKFSDSEYLAYLEPFEGQTHLRALHAALHAEDIVPAKPAGFKERIAPFPPKTNLTADREQAMRRLHSLLDMAYSMRAETYAGQVLIERKMPFLRGIIWVMGFYGELRDNKLVLDSTVCGDKKECTRLVRKRDNTLYEPVRDVIAALEESGIEIQFKPFKKGWTLTLSLADSIVASGVLEALKLYTSSLVAKYGEPEYAGSYNLKGQAFKLFSKANMSDL